MLDTWQITRFKSIYDKTTLKMAPLTVFPLASVRR